MKRLLINTILLIVPFCLFGQNSTVIYPEKDAIAIAHNIVYKDHVSAIFPAKYHPNFNQDYLKNRFTPDTAIISLVEKKLKEQYVDAFKRYLMAEWKTYENNKEMYEWDKLLKNRKSREKSILKAANNKKGEMDHFDRQYLGLINLKGEKIILIHLLNFTNDEFNLKNSLDKEWITGFGDWFESNTESFEYVIDRDKLYFFGWTER